MLEIHDPADPRYFGTIQQGSSGITLDEGAGFGTALASLRDPRSGEASGAYHMAVGACEGGSQTGSVYLIGLSPQGSITRWTRIGSGRNNFTAALSSGAQFGSAIAALPDAHGRGGVGALAVAARQNLRIISQTGVRVHGSVYILYIDADGIVTRYQTIEATVGGFSAQPQNFAGSLASVPDLDGDGVAELAVGSTLEAWFYGAVYVLLLQADGSVKGHVLLDRTSLGISASFGDAIGYSSGLTALDVRDECSNAGPYIVRL